MSCHERDNEKATHLSKQEREVVMVRCFRMVDYLCNTVSDYILNFIEDIPCAEAKQYLLSRPEEFAIRLFEKTIDDMTHPRRESKARLH
jgi:hypothetical protein